MIGGSSGVGKTVVARELAKHLSISLLLLDDIRIAIQQVTTFETNPELHIFLNYRAEQWRNSQSIYADLITVGRAMAKPLNAIVDHHIKVPSVGPIIIEGDGILPSAGNQIYEQKEVCSIFIVEQSEEQLLKNLQSRGRGFNDGGELEQKGFAHASWLYGQWLAQEAKKLGLLVINAQPHQTIFERLLSSISNQ
jgi:2-phosphoglycerate kinase